MPPYCASRPHVLSFKRLCIGAVVFLALLFTAAGCSRGLPDDEASQDRVFTVTVAEAVEAEIGKRLELSGELLPLRQVMVVPLFPGRVAEIRVQEGDRVHQGQLLIRMENIQQELDLRRVTLAVEAGRRKVEELAYLVEHGAVAASILDDARDKLQEGEIQLELARYAYDATFLKSPLAGVVGYIWALEGQLMGNTEAALVMDLDKVLVQLTMDETQLPYLARDMTVQVEIPAQGGIPREGRISYISQGAIPGSRSFMVRVEVDNRSGELKPGMFARVLAEGESRRGVLVPGSALWEDSGKAYLFVASEKRASLRSVQTGLRRDGMVEIVQGLKPGERYLTRIPAGVRDGSMIEETEGD